MNIDPFRHSTRASLRMLAIMAMLVSVAGCEKVRELTASLDDSEAAVSDRAAGDIPSEIADACVILQAYGSEINHDRGYRLADVIRVLVEGANTVATSWEKSSKGYIWNRTRRDELQQTDHHSRYEFAVLPPRDDPRYQGQDCGPNLVRAEGAIVDFEHLPDTVVAMLLRAVFEAIDQERAAGQTDASAHQLQAIPDEAHISSDAGYTGSSQTGGSQGAVTVEWLHGTWGPASHNPYNNPKADCEGDTFITFRQDGTYISSGSYGRFRTDGRTITYFNRVYFDLADDSEDRSRYNQPWIANVARVEANTLREDGTLLRRCQA